MSVALKCNGDGKITPLKGGEASEKYYPYCYGKKCGCDKGDVDGD